MLQLGTITYNIAKDWDLPTLLKRLEALHFEGVELRTSHAHKVEVEFTTVLTTLPRIGTMPTLWRSFTLAKATTCASKPPASSRRPSNARCRTDADRH